MLEAYQKEAAQEIAKLSELSTSSALSKVTIDEYVPPILLCVGPNFNNITSFAVCIADFEFVSDSLIMFADLFFRSVFALDLNYPYRSVTVWSVIQVLFYNIPLAKHFAEVYDFINKIKERVEETFT